MGRKPHFRFCRRFARYAGVLKRLFVKSRIAISRHPRIGEGARPFFRSNWQRWRAFSVNLYRDWTLSGGLTDLPAIWP